MLNFNIDGSDRRLTVSNYVKSAIAFFTSLKILAMDINPLGITEVEAQEKQQVVMSEEDLLDYYSKVIYNWKMTQDKEWVSCGKVLNEKERRDLSDEVAVFVSTYSRNFSDDIYQISVKDFIVGIAFESRFDVCKVDRSTEKFAYKMKIWKKANSHSVEDIEILCDSLEKNDRTVEIGLMQIQWKSGYDLDCRELVSHSYNLIEAAQRLRERGIKYDTNVPSVFWRGDEEGYLVGRSNKLAKISREMFQES